MELLTEQVMVFLERLKLVFYKLMIIDLILVLKVEYQMFKYTTEPSQLKKSYKIITHKNQNLDYKK
jgi:hypothetical protein